VNEHIEKLANVWANRRSKDEKLGITYTFSESALEQFAMLVIQDYENDLRESRREVKSDLGYSRIGLGNA